MGMNPPIKLKAGTYQTRPPRSGKNPWTKICVARSTKNPVLSRQKHWSNPFSGQICCSSTVRGRRPHYAVLGGVEIGIGALDLKTGDLELNRSRLPIICGREFSVRRPRRQADLIFSRRARGKIARDAQTNA